MTYNGTGRSSLMIRTEKVTTCPKIPCTDDAVRVAILEVS